MLAMRAECPIMPHMFWSGLFLAAAMTVASPEKQAATIVSVMSSAPGVPSVRTFVPEEGEADTGQVSDNPDISYQKIMVFKSSHPSDSTARRTHSWLSTAFREAPVGLFVSWDFPGPSPSNEQKVKPWPALQFRERREQGDEPFDGHPWSVARAVASLCAEDANSFAVSLMPTTGSGAGDRAHFRGFTGGASKGGTGAIMPVLSGPGSPIAIFMSERSVSVISQHCITANQRVSMIGIKRPAIMVAGKGRENLSYLPLSRRDPGKLFGFKDSSVQETVTGMDGVIRCFFSGFLAAPLYMGLSRVGDVGVSETMNPGFACLTAPQGFFGICRSSSHVQRESRCKQASQCNEEAYPRS